MGGLAHEAGGDAGAWIALKLVPGVGCVSYQSLLRAFGHPRAVLDASPHAATRPGAPLWRTS